MCLPAWSFFHILNFSADAFVKVSPSYIMYVTPLPFSLSCRFLYSSSLGSGLSDLGVWKWRRRRFLEVAPSSGHGRPQRSVVRSGVSHLPLCGHHQPGVMLLVRGGRHLQPLPDEPETNQGHPQQPADQSHLSHTGTVENSLDGTKTLLHYHLVNNLNIVSKLVAILPVGSYFYEWWNVSQRRRVLWAT